MKNVPPAGSDSLNVEEKKQLLDVARNTIETYVKTGKTPQFNFESPRLSEKRGVFVTLHKDGSLRGCIGYIEAVKPLGEAVVEMAVNSSTRDYRFSPVVESELPKLEIEISVLSIPEKINSKDEIVVGKHGVILEKGFNKGVFLPQVAPEQGWSVEDTLENLCYKAGLPGDAWMEGCSLYTFTADVFSEKEFKQ